ncbi:hypothetical protein GAMM_140039 [Gammaproteobacteria bacterium]
MHTTQSTETTHHKLDTLEKKVTKLSVLTSEIKKDQEKLAHDQAELQNYLGLLVKHILDGEVQKQIDDFKEHVKKIKPAPGEYERSILGMAVYVTEMVVGVVAPLCAGSLTKPIVSSLVKKIFGEVAKDADAPDHVNTFLEGVRGGMEYALNYDADYGTYSASTIINGQIDSLVEHVVAQQKEDGDISELEKPDLSSTLDVDKAKEQISKALKKVLYHDEAYNFCMCTTGKTTALTSIGKDEYAYLSENDVVFDIGATIDILKDFGSFYGVPKAFNTPKDLRSDSDGGYGRIIGYEDKISKTVKYLKKLKAVIDQRIKLLPKEDEEDVVEDTVTKDMHDCVNSIKKLMKLGDDLLTKIEKFNSGTVEKNKKTASEISKCAEEFKTGLEIDSESNRFCNNVNYAVARQRWPDYGSETPAGEVGYFVNYNFEGGREVNEIWKRYEMSFAISEGGEEKRILYSLLGDKKSIKTRGALGYVLEDIWGRGNKVSVTENLEFVQNEGARLLSNMRIFFSGKRGIIEAEDRLQRVINLHYVDYVIEKLHMSSGVKNWLLAILKHHDIQTAINDLAIHGSGEHKYLKTEQDLLDAVNALNFVRNMLNVTGTEFDNDNRRPYIHKITDAESPFVETDIECLLSAEIIKRQEVEDVIASYKKESKDLTIVAQDKPMSLKKHSEKERENRFKPLLENYEHKRDKSIFADPLKISKL